MIPTPLRPSGLVVNGEYDTRKSKTYNGCRIFVHGEFFFFSDKYSRTFFS